MFVCTYMHDSCVHVYLFYSSICLFTCLFVCLFICIFCLFACMSSCQYISLPLFSLYVSKFHSFTIHCSVTHSHHHSSHTPLQSTSDFPHSRVSRTTESSTLLLHIHQLCKGPMDRLDYLRCLLQGVSIRNTSILCNTARRRLVCTNTNSVVVVVGKSN